MNLFNIEGKDILGTGQLQTKLVSEMNKSQEDNYWILVSSHIINTALFEYCLHILWESDINDQWFSNISTDSDEGKGSTAWFLNSGETHSHLHTQNMPRC